MTTLLQKSDLAAASFANTNSNGAGGVALRTDAGSAFRAELALDIGASLVGFIQPGAGAVPRTLQNKGEEVVSVKDYGAVGDGVTDDTAAILNAEAQAYASGATLILGGTYLITSAVNFRRAFTTNAATTFTGPAVADGVTPPVLLNISRRLNVEGVSFKNMLVSAAASDSDQAITPMRIERNNFYNAGLVIGQTLQGTAGYAVQNNTFVCDLGVVCDGVQVKNCSSVSILNNKFRSYNYGVRVEGTIGFSQSGFTIATNIFENVNTGVGLLGKSYCRVSNAEVSNNSIAQDRRNTAVSRGAIEIDWSNNVTVARNTASGTSTNARIRSCMDVKIEGNTFSHTPGVTNNNSSTVILTGVHAVLIRDNKIHQGVTGAYAIVCGVAASFAPILPNSFYGASDIVVHSNDLSGVDRVTRFDTNIKDLRVTENEFRCTAAPHATARQLYLLAGCTGYYAGNTFYAPSGTPVNNLSAGGMVPSLPAEVLSVLPAPTSTVIPPVITNMDAALNNAKSYVTEFTLGDPRVLVQQVNENTIQPLSAWMAGAPGATLGWNSAPYATADGNQVRDLIANGAMHGRVGAEDYTGTRSAMVVDKYGYLTCRDFHVPVVAAGAPVCVPATALEEGALQTVSFRPPLVIDAAVYDPRISELMGNTTLAAGSYFILDAVTGLQVAFSGGTIDTWSQRISGRTCLGQKANGTYVLLTVDGRTNQFGCSKKQAAEKLVSLGCINAYNLDGGGSTTLWYNGAVINTPSDVGGERDISAAMYV